MPTAYLSSISFSSPHRLPVQLDDYGLVQFLPLDISDEESVGELQLFIDNIIQFGEDEDVKVPKVILFMSRKSSKRIERLKEVTLHY